MDLFGTMSVGLSGMNAASRRLEVSASNVANVTTAGALPDASADAQAAGQVYQPLQVVQSDLGQGAGTTTMIVASQPATHQSYGPTAPYADARGMVAMPNVDLASEMVNQMTSLALYKANAELVRTAADEMAKTTFQIMA